LLPIKRNKAINIFMILTDTMLHGKMESRKIQIKTHLT